MSKKVMKNLDILKVISKCKDKQRKVLIEHADADLIHALAECCLNIINSNVPLTRTQKKKLKRYRKRLHDISSSKVKINKKKKILKQKGGFLPLVIGPILSLLGGLAGRAIGKAAGL